VIGDYAAPKTRLPGSGGACEIATNAHKIFMIMRLKRRAFVDKVDFVTSPGHAPDRSGIPGGGPQLVITDRASFNFDNDEREMTLIEMAPGETVESIQAEIGWKLRISPNLHGMTPPTPDELRAIREDLDPTGMVR